MHLGSTQDSSKVLAIPWWLGGAYSAHKQPDTLLISVPAGRPGPLRHRGHAGLPRSLPARAPRRQQLHPRGHDPPRPPRAVRGTQARGEGPRLHPRVLRRAGEEGVGEGLPERKKLKGLLIQTRIVRSMCCPNQSINQSKEMK